MPSLNRAQVQMRLRRLENLGAGLLTHLEALKATHGHTERCDGLEALEEAYRLVESGIALAEGHLKETLDTWPNKPG